MIGLMMVESRLYSINVNYTSEMIFLPLVIIYGDKAPFVEKPFSSAIFLDILNLLYRFCLKSCCSFKAVTKLYHFCVQDF